MLWKRFIARNGGQFRKMMENKIKMNISYQANISNPLAQKTCKNTIMGFLTKNEFIMRMRVMNNLIKFM